MKSLCELGTHTRVFISLGAWILPGTQVAKGELEEQKVLMVTKDMVQDSWADKAMKSAKGFLGQQ